jgi:hypothetical protein
MSSRPRILVVDDQSSFILNLAPFLDYPMKSRNTPEQIIGTYQVVR